MLPLPLLLPLPLPLTLLWPKRITGREAGKLGSREKEMERTVKMLAKETFACFYLFYLYDRERGRERECEEQAAWTDGGWLRLRRTSPHCAFWGRQRPRIAAL